MVEANRAYALGDEEQLRLILQAWERSPEAVPGSDPEATRLRLVRRIAQIEEQLEMLASDLAALKDSPLWKLKAMVDEAAAKGKDLVREMVARLKRDILVATNRLDAMRPPPCSTPRRGHVTSPDYPVLIVTSCVGSHFPFGTLHTWPHTDIGSSRRQHPR